MTTITPSTPAPLTIAELRRVAERVWPAEIAEEWDRVGLVAGRPSAEVRRVLLAVDAVDATVAEAEEWGADALITHHPLLLRGVSSIAEDTAKGDLLARLIRSGCALFTAHTNADQVVNGVSDVLATRLGLQHTEPLISLGADRAHEGLGRIGELGAAVSLGAFAQSVAEALPQTVSGVRVAGDPERQVRRVAVLGGAGDSLLSHPAVLGADVYVTSDLRHHPAQDAVEQARVSGGPALIDVAHWASESLWLDGAAEMLARELPGVEVRVSRRRTDPWVFAVGAE